MNEMRRGISLAAIFTLQYTYPACPPTGYLKRRNGHERIIVKSPITRNAFWQNRFGIDVLALSELERLSKK